MMKTTLAATLLGFAACCAPVLAADDPAALADAKHCTVCHDTKVDKVGPSFRDIARRFKGLNNARPMLVRVVQASGTDTPSTPYHWGATKMPPAGVRVPVSEAEAGILVDYILGIQ